MHSGWSGLHSLSLISMPLVKSVLRNIVESNVRSLRHLYVADCGLDISDIRDLTAIPGLKLSSFRVLEDGEELQEIFNKSGSLDYGDLESSYAGDKNLHEDLYTNSRDWRDEERQSICSHADSDDSLCHRLQTAPYWAWGRYYTENAEESRGPLVFCHQVSQSYPNSHPTEYWKFTHHTGEIAYGKDPWDWFDSWDPEDGDVEEPTPYCIQLSEYLEATESSARNAHEGAGLSNTWLGVNSAMWEYFKTLRPPEGAIYYDRDMDKHFHDSVQ
ncbi:hypothetical protein B0I35DRAFT_424981 [Stachybotrys elegans]|uniref:Uncharacterized protein n=1 Tax=Stachybotrys elegans TaxID=80388 RepID=A0A8K0T355_9HYPO|nr:hypothetical protein B0I35DRAFT_424981 [Stachybotrys elegans]